MPVEMNPVVSSNISAIGHDPANAELHVHFKDGSKYIYPGVSAEKHDALSQAESIGSHFSKHIRPYHKGSRT